MARGAAIGVAMIIPGVSGGTVAVLMNVYDKLIDALGGLGQNFKENIVFLGSVLLGAILAFAAMYFPLKFALERAPFPTVMLFAGLMAGSVPKLFKECKSYGFEKINILSALLPFLLILGVCIAKLFISASEADLSAQMPVWGYFAVIGVAMLSSCALVIPGVSGSMLLLILGYYNEILDTVSLLKTNFGHSVLVLLTLAVGVIIGFFSIAKLMKYLLNKFPRATNWAIIGFVAGSIPAIFITYNNNFPDFVYSALNAVHIAVGCVLCLLGIIATYALTAYVEKSVTQNNETETE